MDDPNNNYDRLEEFFRKKSEEYDIQYREEDWEKLEERLDKVETERIQRRKRWVVAAVVAFLFSVLAYFTIQQQLTINQLNEQLSNQENITQLPETDSDEDGNKPVPQNTKSESDNSDSQDQQAVTEQPTASDLVSNEGLEDAADSQEIVSENQKHNFADIANIMESTPAITIAHASPGFDHHFSSTAVVKPINFISTPFQELRTEQRSHKTNRSQRFLASRNSNSPISKVSLGVLAGPDLSTVGGVSDFYSPGHKIGLSVEYNLTKQIAISVGAIRSKVRYTTNKNVYGRLVDPSVSLAGTGQTIGECILIDIPISLKYNIWMFSHSRLYATGGISSYFMLDEEYRFQTNYYQSGSTQQTWHQRTGTSHLASNATVSVGYEWDFNSNISLRAEPFLKLPLREVGQANINLYSLGSFFSLNYRIK